MESGDHMPMKVMLLVVTLVGCGRGDGIECMTRPGADDCECSAFEGFDDSNDEACSLKLFGGGGYCFQSVGFPAGSRAFCGCVDQHCARNAYGCDCTTDQFGPSGSFPGSGTVLDVCTPMATEGCCQSLGSCHCSPTYKNSCPVDMTRVTSCSVKQNKASFEGAYHDNLDWELVDTCRE